jgi:carotenoid cleavage dioxygenase-like enzyme
VRSDRLVADDHALNPDPSKAGQNRFILEDIDYETGVPRVTLTRYTVDVAARSFSKRPLSPRHVEFPSVAGSVRGKKHRYIYCSPGAKANTVSPQAGVLKVDAEDPAGSQVWLPEPHQFCGESIFQRREGGTVEDDGYLLTLCFDGKRGSSSLLVLDAQHVDRGPVARVPIPDALQAGVPEGAAIAGPGHGLHGTFAPGLVPSLADVQQAERGRAAIPARFLTDGTPS